ncbi:MAG: acetolactate synthase large subunit [Zetaproteobacteria bacterium]|nr:acetolactate synthase large subunit [Pseudobdellovibrionaceae bacterium]
MVDSLKASDLFVKALEAEGVEYIFGIPGEENLDFLESLRTSKIKFILTRHEQGAGFMAATYGRLTGKVGVCLATLGPGATNLVTAAAYAQLGAMPLLLLTGQKPIKKSKQGRFQILDIIEMMQPLTKFTKQIVNGNHIPSLVREAFRLAVQERPGATHLELPEDIADEQTTEPIFEVTRVRRSAPDEKSIQEAVSLIQKAKSPLILIGAGANRKRTSRALKRFVDVTKLYFINTQMGKGVIDERHPLFLGTASLSDNDYIHCAIKNADLIINVGHDVIEKPPFFMTGDGLKVIHVNFTEANIDEVYFPQVEVVGDIANSIWQITDLLNGSKWNLQLFEQVKKELDKHVLDLKSGESFPVELQKLVYIVREAVPDQGIIALDNGIYKIWFSRNYNAYDANTVLLDNALATMGAGLPSAMTASLVHPDKKVLAICGDGGFMMNSQELETAVRLKLNLSILVLCDDAYGMIKWKQAGMNFPSFALDYQNPDFKKYAESYGAKGYKIERLEEIAPTLKKTFSEKGVHLIALPVDYSSNHKILNQDLPLIYKDLIEKIK